MLNISNDLQGALHAVKSFIESVQTKYVDFAPILKVWFEICGIGNLEILLTQEMIHYFAIQCLVCHKDTTSVSLYDKGNNSKTADSFKITYGDSKKYRQDFKQFV